MRRGGEMTATFVRGEPIEGETTELEEDLDRDEADDGPYDYYDADEETERIARNALKLLTSPKKK